jgi:pimeloyl-ACP methyl ester carboxylesterase
MPGPTLRHIETNGIRMRIAEQGTGPLVVLCHGFPESWYSWRHQLAALAAAGFRAVAPDMRGYGGTDAPAAIDQYTLPHLVGDMVGLLDALGAETAVVAGHDWGAPVAWHCALLRPDRFRAVIALSVPFRPRSPQAPRPTTVMPQTEQARFYQLHFQEPGEAEAELEANTRASLRDILLRLSGDVPPPPAGDGFSMVPRQGGLAARLDQFAAMKLPSWLTEADLDHYAADFTRTGFRGGLNWYRNIDRNWELLRPFAGRGITVPALYVAGDRDLVIRFPGAEQVLATLSTSVPRLTGPIMLPGCGHWTQQERPAEVNAAMIAFLNRL